MHSVYTMTISLQSLGIKIEIIFRVHMVQNCSVNFHIYCFTIFFYILPYTYISHL